MSLVVRTDNGASAGFERALGWHEDTSVSETPMLRTSLLEYDRVFNLADKVVATGSSSTQVPKPESRGRHYVVSFDTDAPRLMEWTDVRRSMATFHLQVQPTRSVVRWSAHGPDDADWVVPSWRTEFMKVLRTPAATGGAPVMASGLERGKARLHRDPEGMELSDEDAEFESPILALAPLPPREMRIERARERRRLARARQAVGRDTH